MLEYIFLELHIYKFVVNNVMVSVDAFSYAQIISWHVLILFMS